MTRPLRVPGRRPRVLTPTTLRRGVQTALLCLAAWASAITAQTQTGWQFAGVPALNFNSDEGFGYGVLAEIYQYGDGTALPYRFTIQPRVLFTTKGRREQTVFFDAPHLLPGGLRLDAFVGRDKQVATPYYGIGNASAYDPSLELEPNDKFYRFGRTRDSFRANVQRAIAVPELRVLAGVEFARTSVVAVPEGTATTFLAEELAGEVIDAGWSNGLRVGLVYDSRDQETGPTSGSWSELLVQRVFEGLGSRSSYTRWTAADRRYWSLGSSLVFANRFVLQGVSGDAPFYDLFTLASSFRIEEGLGGAKSVRGILKNRFVGDAMFVWNSEVRWHAADVGLFGLDLGVVLSAFVDSGRVWVDDFSASEILTDLHHGYGGGVRFVLDQNFVVATDVGHSAEAGWPIYIGLGYLY